MLGIIVFAAIVSLTAGIGCAGNSSSGSEISCSTASDCACGKHIETGDCFVGNEKFVNVEEQCPDFCTGIDGKRTTECVDGECKTVHHP